MINLSEPAGRTAGFVFEKAAEVAGIAETAAFDDFADRKGGLGKILFGGGKAAGNQIIDDGAAGYFFENVGKVGNTQVVFLCQIQKCDV